MTTLPKHVLEAMAKAAHKSYFGYDMQHAPSNDTKAFMDVTQSALKAMRDAGYVVTKGEPDEAMFNAAMKAHSDDFGELLFPDYFCKIYTAMLTAAMEGE